MRILALVRHVTILVMGFILFFSVAGNTSAASGKPEILSPSDGGQYSASSQLFTWTANDASISAYALTIGSSEGSSDVYDSGQLSGDTLSHTAANLGNNATLFVRLWHRSTSGLWSFFSSTINYSTIAVAPSIFAPAAGSTFGGDVETISWRDNQNNVSQFWLYAGTTAGAREYLNQSVGTATSHTLSGLPTDGSPVWIRLWYYTNGWKYNDHEYSAYNAGASPPLKPSPEIISPVEHTVFTSNSVTLEWQNNDFVPDTYWLYIGSTQGGSDIISSGSLDTANEYTFDEMPLGQEKIFVRLWFKSATTSWTFIDYLYSSKLYGGAQLVDPPPGDLLANGKQDFGWSPNGLTVQKYQLLVGTAAGEQDLYASEELDGSSLSTSVEILDWRTQTLHFTLRYQVSNVWREEYYQYKLPTQDAFDETFDGNISRWKQNHGSWYNADLRLLSTQVGDDWALASYENASYANLDFSARVRRSDADDWPTFLSIRNNGERVEDDCWCAGDGCYTFEISPAQNYAVWSCSGIEWVQLKAIEHSDLINPGDQWNDLRVIADGQALSFFINGTLAWQGSDASHTHGSVGIGVVNFEDQANNTLDVDWAKLSIPGTSKNLAPEGTASQSSTAYGGVPSRANDGNLSGAWRDGSVTHTSRTASPWWQVDLGRQAWLDTVRLHNRTDCCSTRLSNVHIFIADKDVSDMTLSELLLDTEVVHKYISGALSSTTEIDLSNTIARYVRVQLDGTNFLSLAEVEVIGR